MSLSLIIPDSSISFTCCITSSYIPRAMQQYGCLKGFGSSSTILCLSQLVLPKSLGPKEKPCFQFSINFLNPANYCGNKSVAAFIPNCSNISLPLTSAVWEDIDAILSTIFTSWTKHMLWVWLLWFYQRYWKSWLEF